MPKGKPAPEGTCSCGAEGKLYTSRTGEMVCKACKKREMNAEHRRKWGKDAMTPPPAAKKPSSSTPKPTAPKLPRPEPVGQQRAAQGQGGAFRPMTARALADALEAEEVVLRVTCRTVAATLAVFRAVERDEDVMVAVRG